LAWPFYPLLLAAGAQAIWQLATLKSDSSGDCLTKFQSNRWFGWLVLIAIVAGKTL